MFNSVHQTKAYASYILPSFPSLQDTKNKVLQTINIIKNKAINTLSGLPDSDMLRKKALHNSLYKKLSEEVPISPPLTNGLSETKALNELIFHTIRLHTALQAISLTWAVIKNADTPSNEEKSTQLNNELKEYFNPARLNKIEKEKYQEILDVGTRELGWPKLRADDAYLKWLEQGTGEHKTAHFTILKEKAGAAKTADESILIYSMAEKLLASGAPFAECTSDDQCWLRAHFSTLMRDRALKEGVEFEHPDTLLPEGWVPPAWLPNQEHLLPLGAKEITFQSTNASAFRDRLNSILNHIDGGSRVKGLAILGFSLALFFLKNKLMPELSTLWTQGTSCAVGLYALIFFYAPLRQIDMKRFHAQAMRHPVYAQIWQNTNAANKVEVTFENLEVFLDRGLSRHEASLAHFDSDPNGHKIRIYERLSEAEAFNCLIFETANAFQSARFAAIVKKTLKGEVDREEYARLSEFVEYETCRLRSAITGNRMDKTFSEHWEKRNCRPLPGKPSSHADHYRTQWDKMPRPHILKYNSLRVRRSSPKEM